MLKIKRVYEKCKDGDGMRILVDRLWPRGINKEKARIDRWARDAAPSDGLRKWFAHKEERWPEFKKRYIAELKDKIELMGELKALSKNKVATLVYAAKDEDKNNARVLLGVLKER